MTEDRKILLKLNECLEKNETVALVTVIGIEGSTPRDIGSSMLVDGQGDLIEGTIGGGILEERAKKEAAESISRRESRTVHYNLNKDSKSGENLAMTCGGNVSLFIKVYSCQDRIILAGGGHIAEKLAKIAKILGYSLIIMDDRRERLNDDIFPNIKNLILGDIVENLRKIQIDSNTYIIIVTHGHKHDERALEAVLNSQAKYIGMIGSNNKVKVCFENMLAKGYSKEKLSKVYAPIGIDIGGEAPEEIALAILAEIQGVKYGKDLPYLSSFEDKFE